MNPLTVPYTPIFIKKIDRHALSQTGLILIHKKQEATFISFAEIEKIYIKKNKLDLKMKFGICSTLSLLVSTSIVFMPIELVLISLILYIPILVWMQNYKSYRLQLLEKSNTLYFKNFYSDNKREYIDLVSAVRKEIFDNQIHSSIAFKEVLKPVVPPTIEDYSFQSLSFA